MRTPVQLAVLQALQTLGRQASPARTLNEVRGEHDFPPQHIRWAMWQLCKANEIEFIGPNTIKIRLSTIFEMPCGELNGQD